MPWTDTTSYPRNAPYEPRTWEFSNPALRIVVSRVVHLEGWFLSTYGLGIERIPLKATELETAQAEALTLVTRRLKAMLAGM